MIKTDNRNISVKKFTKGFGVGLSNTGTTPGCATAAALSVNAALIANVSSYYYQQHCLYNILIKGSYVYCKV